MEKIKILFEELSKKFPEIIDEDFVTKVTSIMDESFNSKLEEAKKEIAEKAKCAKTESDDEDKDDVKGDEDKKEIDKEDDDKDKEDEDMKEGMKNLINTLDIFCEEASKEFVEEYSELINESIKTNVSFDIINKLQEVLSEHNITIPENITESETQKRTISDLNKTIASMTEKINELTEKVEEKTVNESKDKVIEIVNKVCENMSKEQTLKFYTLIEDYEVDNLDEFKTKVESLSELISFKKDVIDIKEEKEVDSNTVIYNSISDEKESFAYGFKKNLQNI